MATAKSDISQTLDFVSMQGDSFDIEIRVINEDGSPYDFTGCTAEDIWERHNTSALTFSTGSGLTLTSGKITYSKSAASMGIQTGIYTHGFRITLPSGKVKTWFDGKVTHQPQGSNNAGSQSVPTITISESGDSVTLTVINVSGLVSADEGTADNDALFWNNTSKKFGKKTLPETKTILGINNVDNTSDLNKPISTATQTALDNHTGNTGNPHSVTKSQVGLGNCDNTADIDKPVSTAVQNVLNTHTENTNNPHTVTKAQIGLGSCDNTADTDKPVSTAQQSALDLKVDKVTGKGLSTNDYDNTEKSKLAATLTDAEFATKYKDKDGGFASVNSNLHIPASKLADQSDLNADRITQDNLSDELISQIAGTTAINAVILDASVTPAKMASQIKTLAALTTAPAYIGQIGLYARNYYVAVALTGTMWKKITGDDITDRQDAVIRTFVTDNTISNNTPANGATFNGSTTITVPNGSTGASTIIGWFIFSGGQTAQLQALLGKKFTVRMLFDITSKDIIFNCNGHLSSTATGMDYATYNNVRYNWLSDTRVEVLMDLERNVLSTDSWVNAYISIASNSPAVSADSTITIVEKSWYLTDNNNSSVRDSIMSTISTNKAEVASNKTLVDTEFAKDKRNLDCIELPMPVVQYHASAGTGGAVLSGNKITIPTGQIGTGSYLGIKVPSNLNVGNALYYKPIADCVGKTIKLVLKIKATNMPAGFMDAKLPALYQSPSATLSNKVVSVQGNIITASLYWVVVMNADSSFYIGTSGTAPAASDIVFELMEAHYALIDAYPDNAAIQGTGAFQVNELIRLSPKVSADSQAVTIALPSVIPVAKGRELNIYTNSLREIPDSDEEKTRIRITPSATSGCSMIRNRFRYSKDPTTSNSTFTISAKQESLDGVAFGTAKTATIKDVISNAGTGTLNLLAIGDSISDRGINHRELQNLFYDASQAGGANIRFFGTWWNRADNAPNPHGFGDIFTECRGGWWTTNFLSPARTVGDVMDAANPFWNAGHTGGADTDFTWYLSQINALSRYSSNPISTIDLFMITLGTNDMARISQDQYILNIKSLCSKMWRDFPNCIIIIGTIPPKGLDASNKATIVNWNARLYSEFASPMTSETGTGRSYLTPIGFWIDREMGYGRPNVSRIPDAVTLQKDSVSGIYDGTHPYLIGSLQMADAQFSGMQYALVEHQAYLDSL